MLDRVGDPADIAAEARERFGIRAGKAGVLEIAALVLLLAGGFVAGIGWLVGVVLLWVSDAWTTRDKIIGTLVVPGGFALVLPLAGIVLLPAGQECSSSVDPFSGATAHETCTGGVPPFAQALLLALLVLLAIAPFATTIYVSRRMKRQSAVATT